MTAGDCPEDWWTITSQGVIVSCTDPVVIVGMIATFAVAVLAGLLIAWIYAR